MRFSRPPLMAVLLAAAFSAGNPAGAVPFSPLQVNMLPGRAVHRRAGSGPGTKAFQRAAAKRRNVQRNRRNHRG